MQQILLGALSLGLVWALMTIGVYITYSVLGMPDMTAEGSITFGAAITARLIIGGTNPYLSMLLAIVGGMLAGLANGLLHTKLKIPSLLSGILSMTALLSINLVTMGRANIPLLRKPTVYTPVSRLLPVADPDLAELLAVILFSALLCSVVIVLLYWFFGTEIGSAIRATGNNPNMVRAQGIHTDTTIILGMMLSNALIALSGSLISQAQVYADLQMGTGSIVIGLASLFIGEALLGKRSFMVRLLSMVVGAITYRVIIAFVLRLGMPSDLMKLFTALTVVFALSLPRARQMLQKSLRAPTNGGPRRA